MSAESVIQFARISDVVAPGKYDIVPDGFIRAFSARSFTTRFLGLRPRLS